jgi:hypothetical protein
VKNPRPGLAVALVAILLLLGAPACARRADRCWVCDREIHPGVSATLTLANGSEVKACCPRCALHYQEEAESPVRGIRVSDYPSGRSLAFEQAFLVDGSDETPCIRHHPVAVEPHATMHICYDRCMPSLIAFGDEAAARAFMTDHGGTLRLPGAPAQPSPGVR